MQDDLKTRAMEKVKRLDDLLFNRFGLRLDYNETNHLRGVLEHYMGKRQVMLFEHGASVVQNDDYAKAVLISETIRLFLREIAPKRLRRKNRK